MDQECEQIGNRMLRLPICGGNYNNTSNAGVFYVNLNNLRSNTNGNIGFRSALPRDCQKLQAHGPAPGTPGGKGSGFLCVSRKTRQA